jgi:hypothetical protein
MEYPGYKKPVYRVPNLRVNAMQDDLLQSLIDSAKGRETETEYICRRLVLLNFASIHTVSMVLDAPHST